MHQGLTDLLHSLTLNKIELTVTSEPSMQSFTGYATDDSGDRIYGGQVMAQALSATQQTVTGDAEMHAMHCYFLRMGDIAVPIEYRVETVRNGRSFSTRNVVAMQHNKTIFQASVSFQIPEQGVSHQALMPNVTAPEKLLSEQTRIDEFFEASTRKNQYGWPIDIRYVDPVDLNNPIEKKPTERVWIKASDTLPENTSYATHQQLLAYASDNPILMPAFNPHALTPMQPDVIAVTLNHSLWIHQPFRADEWLLFDVKSDFAGGGRGMGRAKIFSRDGKLVASAMQEGLVRIRK